MWWNNYYGFMWPFMSIFWTLLWIVIIIILFRWVGWRRWRRRSGHWKDRYYDNVNEAEEILRERFAKGEIDEKEYKSRLETLRKDYNN